MGYFFPTPRKGKLGRRRVQRADTRPSGLDLALEFWQQFWNSFQMAPSGHRDRRLGGYQM
jgi:hypothetical protein